MSATVPWHCPVCRTELEPFAAGRPWRCSGCSTRYTVLGTAPLLVKDPIGYLRSAIAGLTGFRTAQEARLEKLENALADPELAWRKPRLERVKRAVEQHIRIAGEQIDELSEAARNGLGVDVEASKPDPSSAHYGLQNLIYPRVDWGATSEGDEQIAATESVVLEQIDRYCDSKGAAVMLGAATGRYACDFAARFARLNAVESCYSYVDFFQRLRKAPMTLFEHSRGISDAADTLVAERRIEMPADRAAPPYVVADACSLPLADASQSAVLSIYFADVMPLSELLGESARVLEPGGRFINFGPLHYHFDDPAWTLTPEEARRYAQSLGFRFEEERWLEMPWGACPQDGGYTVHRVWSFVLTKTDLPNA